VKAAKQRDYERNKAARLDSQKAWRQRNHERVIASALRSKARRRYRLSECQVERVNRVKVFERDGWRCGICRLPVERKDASLDHIVPLSRGGHHTYENCQTAHLKCNISKGARLQEQTT
jgi:5-methylcytosine-specific restriction endonuclease McrA